MRTKTLALLYTLFVFTCLYTSESLSQETERQQDAHFSAAVRSFMDKELIRYGKQVIDRERYLVEQMRMLNREIKSRVSNVSEVRDRYFDGLQNRLGELKALRGRIQGNGSGSLMRFIDNLQSRIEETIDDGKIDFRRQKVFEDGLQLLYIAEEMINLDPGARLEENPEFAKSLEKSQREFSSTFGEDLAPRKNSGERTGPEPTIFDIFKEWKLTNSIKYEVRWTDIQIIKNRLLKNSTEAEKKRMLERELYSAVMSFNYGQFDLADRMFAEILERYDYPASFDDVYFYRAEANYMLGRYHAAQEAYNKVVTDYPTSAFAASAYRRLLNIAYHFKQGNAVWTNFNRYEALTSPTDPDLDDARFVTALSRYEQKEYQGVVSILSVIKPESEFYTDAQYLTAQAYVGVNNLEEAERIYNQLLTQSLSPEYHSNVLLKLGYIKYEKGEYLAAILTFERIPANFPLYDRVLIGMGWSYYKLGLQNREKSQFYFSNSRKNLEILTDVFIVSDYYLEAKTLLGYVYQLLDRPNRATDEYEYVFRSRYTKKYSDELNSERNKLKGMLASTAKIKSKAIQENNKDAYFKADKVEDRLSNVFNRISYSDLSPSSIAAKNEIRKIMEQMAELKRLERIAQERGNQDMLDKISELKIRLNNVLNAFPVEKTTSKLGYNYFDQHPSARKVSVLEDQNEKTLSMRKKSMVQRNELQEQIFEVSAEIAKARARKDYKQLVRLEMQYQRLQDVSRRYDYLDTYAYSLPVHDSNINLEKWSDYGAFGIANVNFALKEKMNQRRAYYSDQIQKINQVLNSRKSLLEYKISQIEGEINVMTRNVRRQERLREREELRRKFQESYFDTHTTEFEEPGNLTPPELDDKN
jgi:TolA-binding protein